MALIDVRHLSLPDRLDDISFSAHAGQLIGVIGPNGAGKSTLLHCLAGLLPYHGQCLFDGADVATLAPRERARHIGLLPQQGDSVWPLSVQDIVAMGRLPWGDNDAAAITEAMTAAGIAHMRRRRIDRLSGGERARVWLARVLAGRPNVLIADEPTASLDLFYQRSVMDSLRAYADQGHVVIIALHDFALAAHYCDQICLMHEGQSECTGTPAEVLTEERLSRVFRTSIRVDLNANPPVIAACYTTPR
ncbi:ABC transporter ATP-binding protein [Pusillimonas minor]|uniref:ABC transporter ATP-binding protein n=1 Tax=Pusillimonas minor TaxID=2697024 RepID=A0A842HNU3_9BURK|nr:ABC transporter ATP-binding protein [Pusillimonas minor]MBC2769564.1 ABC transporter ATP-binding protein [Pusillimonas minor]